MTIIFTLGDVFHIEQHTANHGSVAFATNDTHNFNLDRPGEIMAIAYSISRGSVDEPLVVNVRLTSGAEITALPITAVALQSFVRNRSADTAVSVAVHYTLMIRG